MAAVVQVDGIHSTGMVASVSIAFDASVTAGNAILVGACTYYNNTSATGEITDTRSNSYTEAIESGAGGEDNASVHYALNISGGSCTVSFDSGATSDWMDLGICEVSGLATSSAVDGTPAANGGTGTTATSGTTTTAGGGIVIAAFGGNAASAISTPTGFTLIFESENDSEYPCSFVYKINAAGGANQASWTIASSSWKACIAGFKDAAGGGGIGIPLVMNDQRMRRVA